MHLNCKYNNILLILGISLFLFFHLFSFKLLSQTKLSNILTNSSFHIKKNTNSSIGIEIENYNARTISIESNSYLVLTDSTSKNRINKIWKSRTETFTVEIELDDYSTEIQLTVYNMLGKEAMEIYKGIPSRFDTKYDFSASSLPNGVYLCILVGNNFRKAEKFIISR